MSDKSTPEQFVVQIVEEENEKIAYQSDPVSERRAEKVEDGMGINLNWERFTTRIVPAAEAVPADQVG